MKSLSVWVVQVGENMRFAENPVLQRTGYLVEKLVERGHRVLWWGSAFDHFKKEWLFNSDQKVSLRSGVEFIALGGRGYKKNISLARFRDHRVLSSKFRSLAPDFDRPDVMVVSTPPYDLAYEAALYANERRIPFLVDVRDPWPDLFVDHFPKPLRWLARFFLMGERRRLQTAVRSATAILSVTEDMLEWGLAHSGRKRTSQDQVLGLGFSTFKGSDDRVSPRLIEKAGQWNGKFVVLFVGTISPSYHNPAILLKAARLLSSSNLHFVIAGEGEGLETIRSEAKILPNVTVTGWLNRADLQFVLLRSHVGVCPCSVSLEIPTNKFFAYISEGLPVVSSFGGEIRNIIEKEKVGLFYPPGDLGNLVKSLRQLSDDSVFFNLCSKNATRLFHERFNASVIYSRYAERVEALVRGEMGPNKGKSHRSGDL
ncbi:MAG: glycosyltransferase family 4 protein [Elusimicrobia bacterium]|nr:glycosyltransferase family 4 protein [Elusimicrobiota bacterium]